MQRKLLTVAGTLAIPLVFMLLITLLGQLRPKVEPNIVPPAAPSVLYQTVKTQPVTLKVRTQGEVRPRTDIALTSGVNGQVLKMAENFVDGGAFQKGDVLLQLRDTAYRATLAAAKARVAQTRQVLLLERAESALAEKDYKELGLDETATALTLRKPQLAQAQANYEAALIDLESAHTNFRRTKVVAPFDGRVRKRNVGLGQYITASTALGQIFSTDIAEISFALSDSELAKLGLPLAFQQTPEKPGPKAVLSAVVAGTVHQWEGRIARISAAIDPTTRQMAAIAVVDDPYGAAADNGMPLAMGLFVDAALEGKPFQDAVLLPRTALYNQDIVYVIGDDNKLEERRVTLADADKDKITVVAGLQIGERIVVSPLRGAVAGDLVTPFSATDEKSVTRTSAAGPLDSDLSAEGSQQ